MHKIQMYIVMKKKTNTHVRGKCLRITVVGGLFKC